MDIVCNLGENLIGVRANLRKEGGSASKRELACPPTAAAARPPSLQHNSQPCTTTHSRFSRSSVTHPSAERCKVGGLKEGTRGADGAEGGEGGNGGSAKGAGEGTLADGCSGSAEGEHSTAERAEVEKRAEEVEGEGAKASAGQARRSRLLQPVGPSPLSLESRYWQTSCFPIPFLRISQTLQSPVLTPSSPCTSSSSFPEPNPASSESDRGLYDMV